MCDEEVYFSTRELAFLKHYSKFKARLYCKFNAVSELAGRYPLGMLIKIALIFSVQKLTQEIIYRRIPIRHINSDGSGDANSGKIVEVFMINSTGGPDLLIQRYVISCESFLAKKKKLWKLLSEISL